MAPRFQMPSFGPSRVALWVALATSLAASSASAASFSFDFSTATLTGGNQGVTPYSPNGSVVFDAEKVAGPGGRTLLRFTPNPSSTIDVEGGGGIFYGRVKSPQSPMEIVFQDLTGTSPFDAVFELRFEIEEDAVSSFLQARTGQSFTVDTAAEELVFVPADPPGSEGIFGEGPTTLELKTIVAFVPLPGAAAALLGGLLGLGAVARPRRQA